jgi:hypothetical protein
MGGIFMTAKTIDDDYVDTVEAAGLLGLKPCTVAAWRTYRVNLSYVRGGESQKVLYRRADVLALKEKRHLEEIPCTGCKCKGV